MTHQPITDAVYPPRGSKKRRKPAATTRPERDTSRFASVGQRLGARAERDLYRALGFRLPERLKDPRRLR